MYRVFLVEDEMVILTGLKKLVGELVEGFTVSGEARNGREALPRIRLSMPDLIITDICMKEMSGLDMIEQVREQHPYVPVLIISGYNDFEYVKRALHNKVVDYLLKPIDRIELAKVLRKMKSELDEQRDIMGHTGVGDQADKPLIRKIKKLINSRLDQEISLQYVAEQVHLNHQYLSSLFKLETGKNFVEYVTEQRIERAKSLLWETNLKVYEIALLSGYANAKHFMTMFKQAVGVTASEYRDRMQG